MSRPTSFADVIYGLAPDWSAEQFLLWPPDLFALTSTLLSTAGAERLIVDPPSRGDWPPNPSDLGWGDGPELTEPTGALGFGLRVRAVAKEWREAVQTREHMSSLDDPADESGRARATSKLPRSLCELWRLTCSQMRAPGAPPDAPLERPLTDLVAGDERAWLLLTRVATLHALADEASALLGVTRKLSDPATLTASFRLLERGTLSRLDPSRGRVLPKRHNSAVGISLRALSANLAFHRSSIAVSWHIPAMPERTSNFVFLLLPWPLTVRGSDFGSVGYSRIGSDPSRFGYFRYSPAGEGRTRLDVQLLQQTLSAAIHEAGRVDCVVLPEGAIHESDMQLFEGVIAEQKIPIYIAGIRATPEEGGGSTTDALDENYVVWKSIDEGHRGRSQKKSRPLYQGIQQHKHHRWCLDAGQITQYQLGAALTLDRLWWEGIRLHPRQVRFQNLDEETTVVALICEDLARQDPTAELIRSVGPSLVVTVLMDGPQLADRWSARYACVLADDPGSSVLTLTSFGMVERWSPPWRRASRVVALWKDPTAPPRELELPEGASGLLLYASKDKRCEICADGRVEEVPTTRLIYAGSRAVHADRSLGSR